MRTGLSRTKDAIGGMLLLGVSLNAAAGDQFVQCRENSLVPYARVYIDTIAVSSDKLYVVDVAPLDENTKQNTIFVLKFYHMRYEIEDGNIMIPCEIWRDQDHIANITLKASDPEWQKRQRELLHRLESMQ